jgi:hypothetical protein
MNLQCLSAHTIRWVRCQPNTSNILATLRPPPLPVRLLNRGTARREKCACGTDECALAIQDTGRRPPAFVTLSSWYLRESCWLPGRLNHTNPVVRERAQRNKARFAAQWCVFPHLQKGVKSAKFCTHHMHPFARDKLVRNVRMTRIETFTLTRDELRSSRRASRRHMDLLRPRRWQPRNSNGFRPQLQVPGDHECRYTGGNCVEEKGGRYRSARCHAESAVYCSIYGLGRHTVHQAALP